MVVVCKYFQQGNCRFGQYCRFEHINNFGDNAAIRNKNYIDGKNIALIVAEDILTAERGGQWILSCFGPFKEQPCIPGMEDVSPEEVRWKMYQAQKDGTVDQVKIQFQQMCQDMKAKHEALKHPTPEMVTMLEKIQKSTQDKPNNPFGASPLAGTNNSTTGTSSLFGSSNFTSNTGSSIFSSSNTSVFGGKPTFGSSNTGSSSIFGGSSSTAGSLFGGNNKVAPSAFGTVQNTQQSFGNSSIFGGTSQPTFGQAPTFGITSQASNIFARPVQTSQSGSVFGGATTTASTSIFATPTASVFGESKQPTANIFGGNQVAQATAPSPFGSKTDSSSNSSTSVFGQQKSTPSFGTAPVFGSLGNTFGNASTGNAIFNTQSATPNNVFLGGSNSTFGITSTPSNATFGATATTQNVLPFGTITSTSTKPFNSAFNTQQASFVTSNNVAQTVPNTFGSTQNVGNVFGNSNTNNTIANATATPGFSPFTPKGTESGMISTQNNIFNTTSNPYGTSPFVTATDAIIDDSVYSAEGKLTDDERSQFSAEQFILKKIPLKPPTKDLR